MGGARRIRVDRLRFLERGLSEYYLFYCTADWEVVTDTWHPTEMDAVNQAKAEFGDVTFERVPAAGTQPLPSRCGGA